MIKIFIVDDHAIVREGLRQILQDVPDMVIAGEAFNGIEALEQIRKNNYNYDIVVLDISMPGMNGIDVLKQLKLEKPEIAVLMLTIFPEDQYAIRALKNGASGYLTKDSVPDELVAALKKISQGGKYITLSIAERLSSILLPDSDKQPHEILSDREYQIMCMIAKGKPLKTIAEDLSVSIKTISTYRSRILEKMNLKTNADIIRYAIEEGLIQ